ncbi:hypothetical protein FB45DRAFT_876162 [Roridomyces roridus]|uniref:Uncharacterized protein n=1 Tax=Roridomyces roridus TaxID=1738132 RepID=A0AAD7F965_9AGAR|nr:hypothetical protein FB45DRAFT_876162 [Roridomyces roridus]
MHFLTPKTYLPLGPVPDPAPTILIQGPEWSWLHNAGGWYRRVGFMRDRDVLILKARQDAQATSKSTKTQQALPAIEPDDNDIIVIDSDGEEVEAHAPPPPSRKPAVKSRVKSAPPAVNYKPDLDVQTLAREYKLNTSAVRTALAKHGSILQVQHHFEDTFGRAEQVEDDDSDAVEVVEVVLTTKPKSTKPVSVRDVAVKSNKRKAAEVEDFEDERAAKRRQCSNSASTISAKTPRKGGAYLFFRLLPPANMTCRQIPALKVQDFTSGPSTPTCSMPDCLHSGARFSEGPSPNHIIRSLRLWLLFVCTTVSSLASIPN